MLVSDCGPMLENVRIELIKLVIFEMPKSTVVVRDYHISWIALLCVLSALSVGMSP